jgi:hypothetical protein
MIGSAMETRRRQTKAALANERCAADGSTPSMREYQQLIAAMPQTILVATQDERATSDARMAPPCRTERAGPTGCPRPAGASMH